MKKENQLKENTDGLPWGTIAYYTVTITLIIATLTGTTALIIMLLTSWPKDEPVVLTTLTDCTTYGNNTTVTEELMPTGDGGLASIPNATDAVITSCGVYTINSDSKVNGLAAGSTFDLTVNGSRLVDAIKVDTVDMNATQPTAPSTLPPTAQ